MIGKNVVGERGDLKEKGKSFWKKISIFWSWIKSNEINFGNR